MSMPGKIKHENELAKIIERLKSEGYNVINLQCKSPDAIATKDGKLIAVEVLGKYRKKTGKYKGKYRIAGGFTKTQKRNIYGMFDEVLIFTFNY